MIRFAVVLTSITITAGAAFGETPTGDDAYALGPGEPGSMIPSGIDRGYVRPPLGTPVPPSTEHVSKVIFVNPCRGGCTFTKSSPGVSDAINNLTWLGSAPQGSTITISEFSHPQEVWDATIACIRDVYLPYGVSVVDVDPGQVPHHEAVLAGRAQELPIAGALGVAPLGAGACAPADNVISFSFANNHGPTQNLSLAEAMCWTVAQESAHSYGLEHEFDCSDPLTYLDNCDGPKYFRDIDAPCGEFSERPCVCGGNAQNSHERLLGVLGMGQVTPPPVVNIGQPADGSTVNPGFSVFATAVDDRGVNHIDLYINGWKWAEIPGVWKKSSSYVLDIPGGVPDGVMNIEVRACNDTGSCGSDMIQVTRGQACGDASACRPGQKCEAGACSWDPPVGVHGDACTYNEYCTTELCADIGGGQMACTSNCFGGVNDNCPDPLVCNAQSGQAGICATPPEEEETGCCSAGGSDAGSLAFNLGLGTLVGLIAIRRRRKRA